MTPPIDPKAKNRNDHMKNWLDSTISTRALFDQPFRSSFDVSFKAGLDDINIHEEMPVHDEPFKKDSKTLPEKDSKTLPKKDSKTLPEKDSKTLPEKDSKTLPEKYFLGWTGQKSLVELPFSSGYPKNTFDGYKDITQISSETFGTPTPDVLENLGFSTRIACIANELGKDICGKSKAQFSAIPLLSGLTLSIA